jgi:hypothetical protein
MIECDPHQGAINTYFVSNVNTNSSASSSSQDLRFNTLGTFQIATVGFQAAKVNIGELWVTYQVTFLKPKLYESLGYASDSIDIWATVATDSNLVTGPVNFTAANVNSQTIPFKIQTAWDFLYFFASANNLDIHFPLYAYPTEYIIIYSSAYTAAATPAITATPSAGDYAASSLPVIMTITQTPAVAVVSGLVNLTFRIRVPGGIVSNTGGLNTPKVLITITGNLVANTGRIQIQQVPYAVTPSTT